jgi:UDP-2,3-diacylglucosamine hydrolase
MGRALGLVSGAGALPALMAREARRAGWRVVAFALAAPEPLAPHADRVLPCQLGDVGPILGALAEEEIRHVVLAGRVRKDVLFQGAPLDTAARELLARAADWTDEALLGTAVEALAAMGIEVLDQREFLAPWLVPCGAVAGPPVPPERAADVARGLALARELAQRGIGQTVVLRAGSVAAVEAMEGTDEAVRRGLALAGRGAVVVKASAPAHDYRLDVPTVGPDTVADCAAGGAAVLALEAGRVLLLERERVEAEANRAGMSVVGVAERPAGD